MPYQPDLLAEKIGYTLAEMIAEVSREIEVRHAVYDRLVQREQITREIADRRIDLMVAVRRVLVAIDRKARAGAA